MPNNKEQKLEYLNQLLHASSGGYLCWPSEFSFPRKKEDIDWSIYNWKSYKKCKKNK